jgi:hypothetical protein
MKLGFAGLLHPSLPRHTTFMVTRFG